MNAARNGAVVDAELARLSEQQPDTLVGVLIRVSRSVGEEERAALARAGLRVGSVGGSIVTGELAAGHVPRLARLEFVTYIELARVLEPTSRESESLRPVPEEDE